MDMKIIFPGGKKVNVIYKGFTIQTDQAKHAGGENSAPTPFDYFLASIGACAGSYVLSFCQQRNIPTTGIKIIQCMIRNEQQKRIEMISLEIQLPPEFPEQYKNALIRSAELCAVKKYIQDPPNFKIYTVIKN